MFNVYDVSTLDANEFLVWTENNIDGATKFHNQKPQPLEPVFSGLSQGELSQVLLDYTKSDFSKGEQEKAVSTLSDTVQFSKHTSLTQNDRDAMTIERFEDILYSLPTEKLCGLWIFSKHTFFIKDE